MFDVVVVVVVVDDVCIDVLLLLLLLLPDGYLPEIRNKKRKLELFVLKKDEIDC